MGEATWGGGSGDAVGAALTWPVPLQLSQQSRCPDFFLFLCRLLSPLLKAFAQAAAFLPMGQLPDTGEVHTPLAVLMEGLRTWGRALCLCPTYTPLPAESGYTDQLLQFLRATAQEDGFFGESCPSSQPRRQRVAGGCCPLLSSDSPNPGRRAVALRTLGCGLSPTLGGSSLQEEEKPVYTALGPP